jgi:hypothetical protein
LIGTLIADILPNVVQTARQIALSGWGRTYASATGAAALMGFLRGLTGAGGGFADLTSCYVDIADRISRLQEMDCDVGNATGAAQ